MRATILHKAGDVRVEQVPDATIRHATDAVVRVTRACICGSDLWPYNDKEAGDAGQAMGHEAIGVVEAVESDVRRIKVGDVVITPFAFSDGSCLFCDDGLRPHASMAASSAPVARPTAHGPRRSACRRPTARCSRSA